MYRIYCDFDATVTVNDVWNVLFTRYGKPLAFEIWKEFGHGNLTAAECIRIACSTVENADPAEALAMFRSQPLRPGFVEFVAFCKTNGLELRIVSDGFTGYIRPILAENRIEVPYNTNDIEVQPDGTLSVEFKNGRESCRHCAACKCGHIIETSADEDTIVYVGDGYSDVCPVQMSDVVFARDMLLASCSKRGIPHHPYEDFFTVRSILETYLSQRPKYKRKPAEHRRKELYMIE